MDMHEFNIIAYSAVAAVTVFTGVCAVVFTTIYFATGGRLHLPSPAGLLGDEVIAPAHPIAG